MTQEFLNKDSLKYLIDQIQGQIIQCHSYTNITANEGNGIVFFLKIKRNKNNPWILKYRITSEIPEENNSTQIADVIIGGNDNKLSYYNTSNIIYDKFHNSAIYNSIALNSVINEPHLLGINIKNKFNSKHNLKIEIMYIYGCRISFIENPYVNFNWNSNSLEQWNFSENGTFIKNDNIKNFVKREELSQVAFSGDYNDLLNKPSLLQIDADEEELYFYLN